MKQKIEYINGIKGIACLIVMLGHYLMIYALADNFVTVPPQFSINGVFTVFMDANSGLIVFCVLMGYLAGVGGGIYSIETLIKKMCKRFLRFFFPVLGANIFIYLIQKIVGFYNADTIKLFNNNWFQRYYSINFTLEMAINDAVNPLIKGSSLFNAPYWVLKSLFFCSIIIYIGNYIENKYTFKQLIYVVELLVATYFFQSIGFAAISGTIVYKIGNNKLIKSFDKKLVYLIALISFIMLDGGHRYLNRYMHNTIFYFSPYYKAIWFSILFLAIDKISIIKKLLESKYLIKLSKISFGIYSLHWPIICSFSSLLFLNINFNFKIYILIIIPTIIVTIILAQMYNITVERSSEYIIHKLVDWRIL